jgi:hypothetical protein
MKITFTLGDREYSEIDTDAFLDSARKRFPETKIQLGYADSVPSYRGVSVSGSESHYEAASEWLHDYLG